MITKVVQRLTRSVPKQFQNLRLSSYKLNFQICFQREFTRPHPLSSTYLFSSSHRTFMNRSDDAAKENNVSYINPDKILNQCSQLYDSLSNLNEKLGGVAIPMSSPHTSLPFCLLVGNHSSGKSSFINYILQRDIQKAGVAPTDDSFTVIAPGSMDLDADGPTLVGDPDLGFSGLRQFGPTLIHHSQLKYRESRLNFMLVDSPGMIDSPGGNQDFMDRGYDFPGVVRWLASRADIVLVFFDPDKVRSYSLNHFIPEEEKHVFSLISSIFLIFSLELLAKLCLCY
mmetsp:Transcript_7334/g.8518  ORF Transcript_7334/g.8518 Transcript_7334/m.8518 type:complete len:284 (+) Transcript_7334:148-999(+)